MAKRPYISYLTKDLVRLFEKHPNDKKVLTELKNELVHRNKEKAIKLLARVEARLAAIGEGGAAPEQIPLPMSPKPDVRKPLPPLGEQATLPGIEIPTAAQEENKPCPNSSKPQEPSSNQQDEKVCISVTLPKPQWSKTKIWDFLLKIFKRK